MWIFISHREQGAPVPWKIRVRFAPGPDDPDPVYPDPAPAPPAQPKKRRKSRARGDPWTKPKPKRPRPNLEQPPPDPNTTLGPHEEFQYSYGGYLMVEDDPSFSHVDRELRKLVVRCMMELPRDRPELTELEDIFKAKLHPSPPPGGNGGGSAPPPGGPPPGGPPPGGPPPDDDDDDDSGGGPPPPGGTPSHRTAVVRLCPACVSRSAGAGAPYRGRVKICTSLSCFALVADIEHSPNRDHASNAPLHSG